MSAGCSSGASTPVTKTIVGAPAELLEAGGDAVQRAQVLLGVRGDLDVLRERRQLLAGGADDDDRP